MSQKSKMNIPMLAACILLCLTLISVHMTSGLYARYVSRDSGEDSARVASFDVEAKWGDNDVSISATQEDNGSYNFTITNNSEVDVKYDLVLTFEEAFPKYLKVSIKEENAELAVDGTVDEENGKVVSFANLGMLDSNGDSANYELTFTVIDIDALVDSASGEDSGAISVDLQFNAVVRLEQID